ncbi:hypothetical protein KKC00_00310 [Patescibacteria group bacterium]|nr:hypothetical protein [Patescibacteria group bacterium]
MGGVPKSSTTQTEKSREPSGELDRAKRRARQVTRTLIKGEKMKNWMPIITILMTTLVLFAGCAGTAYKKATKSNSIEAYRQFVSEYPENENTSEAKKKIEELFWQQKKIKNTISGYETYLQEYSDGKYVKEAKIKIEDMIWHSAKTAQDYKQYLKKYSVGKYAKDAGVKIEDILWVNVQATNNLAAYDRYLSQYPDGRFVLEASTLAEESAWQDAIKKNEKILYEVFIARFTNSVHLADAKQKVENFIWDEAENARTNILLYRKYLDRYPNGLYAKKAEDCVDWEKFEAVGTMESFKKYLSLHPNGRFVVRAKGYLGNQNKPAPKLITKNINSTIDWLTNSYFSMQMKRFGGGTYLIEKENPARLKFGGDGKWIEIEVNKNILPMQGAVHYWTSSTGTDVKNPKVFYVIDEGFKCQYEDNTYRYSNKKWYYDLGNETFFRSK